MPHLINLFNVYPDSSLHIIGINTNDHPAKVKKEVENFALPYQNLIGQGTSIVRDYKITTLPYLYIVDQEGIIDTSEMFLLFEMMNEIVENLGGSNHSK